MHKHGHRKAIRIQPAHDLPRIYHLGVIEAFVRERVDQYVDRVHFCFSGIASWVRLAESACSADCNGVGKAQGNRAQACSQVNL